MIPIKKFFFGGLIVAIGIGALFVSIFSKNQSEEQENLVADLSAFASSITKEPLMLGEGFERYINSRYGFALEYPADWKIDAVPENDAAETILFQKKGTGSDTPKDQKEGFQMFVSRFEEETTLTRERILEDLPSAVIEDPQSVVLNPQAPTQEIVEGLLFWSEDSTIGKTREVWFVRNGYLYEVTAYPYMDNLLAGILSSSRFFVAAKN